MARLFAEACRALISFVEERAGSLLTSDAVSLNRTINKLSFFFLVFSQVGTDESQESSMTDADDTQLHAAESSDEF